MLNQSHDLSCKDRSVDLSYLVALTLLTIPSLRKLRGKAINLVYYQLQALDWRPGRSAKASFAEGCKTG